MSTKHRAVIIMIENDKILLLYRFKNGDEYYVFPGGGVEEGEDLMGAATREAKEETGMDVTISKLLWDYNNHDRIEHFFLADKFTGELKIGGPEEGRQSPDNVYRLEWVALDKIKDLKLVPEEMRDKVLEQFSK
ncbi:MAG: NUDIX domain-containing protein [bacterium]|nr:NUDIX domain-containing protein [bacterium]